MITEWESHLLADPLPPLQHNGPLESVGLFKVWALFISTSAPFIGEGKRRGGFLNGEFCSNDLGKDFTLCGATRRKLFFVVQPTGH